MVHVAIECGVALCGRTSAARTANQDQETKNQERRTLKSARAFDRILVNSLFSRESVLRGYGLESSVCYLGIDAHEFHPMGVPRQNVVLCIGGLCYGKGPDRVIAALGAIPERQRPELLWIGNFASESQRLSVERQAAAFKVSLRIMVMVSDSEVVNWLNRAAVMVYAPRLEPFGFAPLEAAACELPVVAIAEGGVRESVKDGRTGILVDSAEPAALTAAILQALNNRDRANALGKAGREYVLQHWTWAQAVDRLERVLVQTAEAKQNASGQSCPTRSLLSPGNTQRALAGRASAGGRRPNWRAKQA